MNNNLEEIATKAISIANKMKVLEDALKPLEEEYNAYKVKLEREMRLEGRKLVEVPDGKVSWVDRQTKSLDKMAIMQRLGLNNLSEFEKVKMVSFIKITPVKEEKE